ncbi:uncharacterized protein BXZ73DRAFT_104649 [Epithele typhae]|uniref:uncharacterized protein n=1 Tax=Epithele typhae TaxID=378194 RepID=UPI002008A53D|nr:uncharacterized protein BXZ73DRAFT_104649 [Epithele typhae]KAH9920524.1 hypothetical protein BXZ73DRAFT_104649 [Epithele typhae]
MSRRAAPGASPFGAPPRRAIHDPNESAFSRFMREEIFSPENLPGNISVLTAVTIREAEGAESVVPTVRSADPFKTTRRAPAPSSAPPMQPTFCMLSCTLLDI